MGISALRRACACLHRDTRGDGILSRADAIFRSTQNFSGDSAARTCAGTISHPLPGCFRPDEVVIHKSTYRVRTSTKPPLGTIHPDHLAIEDNHPP